MINLLFMTISTVKFRLNGLVIQNNPEKDRIFPICLCGSPLLDGDEMAHGDIALVGFLPELRSSMALIASWFSLVDSTGGVLGSVASLVFERVRSVP